MNARVSVDSVRRALASGGAVARVLLPSGECWASVVAVSPKGSRVTVSVAGVPRAVALDAIREVRSVP